MIDLAEKAKQIRSDVIRVAVKNNRGHIASSLSKVEIMVWLHYERMEPEDKFIMSSGHSSYVYYAILADKGIVPRETWESFDLPGCLTRMPEYEILASTGSLGQGLPIAAGIAYAKKIAGEPGEVYCIVGDGEMQEGSCWEALNFINHHQLDNIHVYIDWNKLQAMDWCTNVCEFDFPDHPCIEILSTIKGKGLKCAENVPKFHYRVPTKEELDAERDI